MGKRLRFDSEQFKIFKSNLKEALWGDLHLATRRWWKEILEADSEARMERYLGLKWYERGVGGEPREDSRNGWYERDYSTIVRSLRLRIRRTRKRSFLPAGVRSLQRVRFVLRNIPMNRLLFKSGVLIGGLLLADVSRLAPYVYGPAGMERLLKGFGFSESSIVNNIQELQEVIRKVHGSFATHVETVPVK